MRSCLNILLSSTSNICCFEFSGFMIYHVVFCTNQYMAWTPQPNWYLWTGLSAMHCFLSTAINLDFTIAPGFIVTWLFIDWCKSKYLLQARLSDQTLKYVKAEKNTWILISINGSCFSYFLPAAYPHFDSAIFGLDSMVVLWDDHLMFLQKTNS